MELEKLTPKLLDTASIEQADLLTLLESATNGLWLWLLERKELFWSQGLANTLGYDLGNDRDIPDVVEMTHPEDQQRHRRAIEASLDDGQPYYVEVRFSRKDGSVLWLAASGMWHRHPDGTPHTMVGFVRDISARIAAAGQLAASEARFRSFFDQVPAAVYIKDTEWRHLYGNEMAATIAGTDLDRFIGAKTTDLFDPDTAERLIRADREAIETKDRSACRARRPSATSGTRNFRSSGPTAAAWSAASASTSRRCTRRSASSRSHSASRAWD